MRCPADIGVWSAAHALRSQGQLEYSRTCAADGEETTHDEVQSSQRTRRTDMVSTDFMTTLSAQAASNPVGLKYGQLA